MRISMISIKQYYAVTAKAKVLKNPCIAYFFSKKTCRMLNWSPTAKQSFEFWVLSFELVGFADFELFNVELTDNSQLQIQKILMREAH